MPVTIVGSHKASIVVVTGLPGAGKNTYIETRFAPGDLVLDVDALFGALAGGDTGHHPGHLLPFVCAARDAVVERLCRPVESGFTAWLITCDPLLAKRWVVELGADLVEIAVDEAERRERLASRR